MPPMVQDRWISASIADRIGEAIGATKDWRGRDNGFLVGLSHLGEDDNVDDDAKDTQQNDDLPETFTEGGRRRSTLNLPAGQFPPRMW